MIKGTIVLLLALFLPLLSVLYFPLAFFWRMLLNCTGQRSLPNKRYYQPETSGVARRSSFALPYGEFALEARVT
jgi:hypothetical protein